jgi:hypothetical protein
MEAGELFHPFRDFSFARGEPLRRVPECVFAVLALESEPVDAHW